MENQMTISQITYEQLGLLKVHLENFKPNSRNTEELINASTYLNKVRSLCSNNLEIESTCGKIGNEIGYMLYPNPDSDNPMVYESSFEDKVIEAHKNALSAYHRLYDLISKAGC
jgi:hypothetical protein